MQGKEKSMFLQERLHRFPVTLLAIEVYHNAGLTESSTELEMAAALTEAMSACGVQNISKEDIEYFTGRLEAMSRQQTDKTSSPPSSRRSLGTAYAKHFRELPLLDILGMMTDYDPDSLRYWYCKADIEATMGFVERYVQTVFEKIQVGFEMCMYGFGGKYDGDTSGSKVIDANSKEGMAALSQFGIGSLSVEALEQLGFNGVGAEWFGGSPAESASHEE